MGEPTNKRAERKTASDTKLASLEALGEKYLVRQAPFQIPADGRETLVKFLPWIALIAGLIMLWSAWGLYNIYRLINGYAAWVVHYGPSTTYDLGLAGWLSIVMLLVTAVLYLAAFGGLQKNKKSAWNLLVYAELVYVGYGLVWLFGAGGFPTLLTTLVSALIGLYLLFQVRSYYR